MPDTGMADAGIAPPVLMGIPTDQGPLALNVLHDNYGARQRKQIKGRGPGSGRGRKCGRGMKGTRARAGNKGLLRHQGGDHRYQLRFQKMGKTKVQRNTYKELHLGHLQAAIDSGRLTVPADRPLDVKDLFDSKIITLRQKFSGVKLTSRKGADTFNTPINIEVQRADPDAIAAVEAAGGKIESVYYSRLSLRGKLKPERFENPGKDVTHKHGRLLPRPALPPPRLMRDVYASEANRGYLRDVQPGDVIRPHEHPKHVDLSLRHKPKYPGWHAADQQAMANGELWIKADGTLPSAAERAAAMERRPTSKTVMRENMTRHRDRPWAPPAPPGKRLVRDRIKAEEDAAIMSGSTKKSED